MLQVPLRVADRIDQGEIKDVGHLSAMAKVFASDTAMKVTQIYEGTDQIQRNVIGARLVKQAATLSHALITRRAGGGS